MTSQEEQMLNSLIERVNSTKLTEKDPDAADLLTNGLKSNPDALYVLAQSVLVQNIALEQARAQLSQAQGQLQQQPQQPAHASTFLGRLLGDKPSTPPPPAPAYRPQAEPEYQTPYQGSPYPNQGYQNAPYQGQPYPPAGGPQYGGGGFGGPGYGPPPGQPSFLRSAAQTAAGVAAGALAFEGVESLLHGGFGHPGMGMGMGGWGMPGVGMGMGPGMGYERPIEENVVNNYYDTPGGGEHHSSDAGQQTGFENDNSQLADQSWTENSGQGFDDSGSGLDDSGSFGDSGDGGGSNDDSGGF